MTRPLTRGRLQQSGAETSSSRAIGNVSVMVVFTASDEPSLATVSIHVMSSPASTPAAGSADFKIDRSARATTPEVTFDVCDVGSVWRTHGGRVRDRVADIARRDLTHHRDRGLAVRSMVGITHGSAEQAPEIDRHPHEPAGEGVGDGHAPAHFGRSEVANTDGPRQRSSRRSPDQAQLSW